MKATDKISLQLNDSLVSVSFIIEKCLRQTRNFHNKYEELIQQMIVK